MARIIVTIVEKTLARLSHMTTAKRNLLLGSYDLKLLRWMQDKQEKT